MHKNVWFKTKEEADTAAYIHQLKMRRKGKSARGRRYEGYYCDECGRYHYEIKKE